MKTLSSKFKRLKQKLSPRRRKVFKHDKPEDRFTEIYNSNYWRNDESISGSGSTLEYSANLRAALPELFEKYNVKQLLDAPCGDYNWMRRVVEETGIAYIGGDIVAPLIAQNQQKYGGEGVQFRHLDITKGPLPKSDMMMVRDCLFHLSYADILKFLQVFMASDIALLLTSSHVNTADKRFENEDILSGNFRSIDLFAAPFGFAEPSSAMIKDDPYDVTLRHMHLFSRDQVAAAVKNLQANLS